MYKLQMISLDKWAVIRKNKKPYIGSMDQVISYSVKALGIPFQEIDIAIEEIIEHGDDTAEFGIMRSFLYTFNSKKEIPQWVN